MGRRTTNTAIFATTEYGDASSHSDRSLIALVAGGASGELVTGHHFDGGGNRNVAEIPYTIMKDALGLDIDGFGTGTPRATATFPDMIV